MKLSSIELYEYSLPLKRKLRVHSARLTERCGLLLCLTSEQGMEGIGEIAPLPGFSQESLEEAIAQLQGIESFLFNAPIPERLEVLDGKFRDWLGHLQLKPSVQFGVEMAMLNIIANMQDKPLCQVISKSTHGQIRINGLLQGSKSEVTQQARQLVDEGFTALKLKVGNDVEEDIAKVNSVSESIRDRALLRIDANQAWDLNTAVHFGHEVGCAAVDYIEEPFKDIEKIPDFFEKTTIPVALDESLLNVEFEELKSISGVDVLVLKPSILGGIEKVWQLTQKAKRLAIEVIISSSFESDVGILTLAHLAGSSARDTHAGLDTLKWFQKGLLNEKMIIKRGKIDIHDKIIKKEDINFKSLKKIA